MSELAGATDPKALIPGEPAEIRTSLANLTRYGEHLVEIGSGLRKIDTGGWTGRAADRFRERFDTEPSRWSTAGDAFHATATALGDYASSLEWAQGEAHRAIQLWQRAEQTSQQAQAEHDHAAAAAEQHAAAAGVPSPPAAPFHDPGDALRAEAERILRTARAAVQVAGHQATAIVQAAQRNAPAEPTAFDTIASAFGDGLDAVAHAPADLAHGIIDGVGDAVDKVGSGFGHLVHGLGEGLDVLGLDGVGHSLETTGSGITESSHDTAGEIHAAADDASALLGGDEVPGPRVVFVDQREYPEAADHIREAQMGTSWRGDVPFHRTQPMELTIDRDGADERRVESMKQVPDTRRGADRDEYPMAMFDEGGAGSSVKYIDPTDNRGAGSSVRAQTADLADGERVIIVAD